MINSRYVAVVAGGHSVTRIAETVRLKMIENMCVIGVNDSALHMPVDYALTMDRLWLENRFDQLKELGITTYYRHTTAKNVRPAAPQFIGYFGNIWRGQMTLDPGHLWGDNSGRVALNLAYQLRPKKVFMIGFDFKLGPNGEQHWYPPYPWGGGSKPSKLQGWSGNLDYLAEQFHNDSIDLKVVGAKGSTLIPPERIPRISFEEFNKGKWSDSEEVVG